MHSGNQVGMNDHEREYDTQQSADWIGDAICGHVTPHTFIKPGHAIHSTRRQGIPVTPWSNHKS